MPWRIILDFYFGDDMHDILVVGVGYVGLVTGTCFAEMGNRVTCLDINQDKIEGLKRGKIPIHEKGLEEMVKRNSIDERLSFTTSYSEGFKTAKICFLAVDTPVGPDGACDLTSIKSACEQIARMIHSYTLIAIKSTVPVGTAALVRKIISQGLDARNVQIEFDVVSNPEFLKEGTAVDDFMNPDRVVVGVESGRARLIMQELYRPFMLKKNRVVFSDIASAELAKYASNAMLTLRISFMNWLSNLCDATGGNILQVRQAVGSDPRIGSEFLWAGCGYGGSCFPKDIQALHQMAKENGLPTTFLDAVQEVNAHQKEILVKKIEHYFSPQGGVKGKTIGILGLAFKPETDDMREAPSLVIIEKLLSLGATVRLFDPVAMDNAKKVIPQNENVSWCRNELDAAKGAHAIALVTEWKQFRLLDFVPILKAMQGRGFFDGRNQYTPREMATIGFDYFSIGQSPALHLLEKDFASNETLGLDALTVADLH